ncbi:MAG: type VI secretion system baseplate subunit TssG [Burkholderiales bacterium]|nr:type VI secretion system baseplate subunit TssG [Burkholderiales bacterium]
MNAPAELPALTPPEAEVEALFARLAKDSSSFDLFQAMRRIECAFPDKPRLGDAMRPVEEPFRFAQEASLIFAPAPVAGFERPEEGAKPRLVQRVFGFLGPNGAMPIHFTEYARERLLYNSDRTFGRFLDMLLHRFGLFFYRAWARAQPVVALDRPDDAPIVRHVGSLFGLIEPATRGRDALGDFPKLFFAGRLARSVRDADGLEAWLALQFGGPVRVDQFQGHWMPLGREERTRLQRDGQPALGRGAVLGKTVWDVQHKFRIVIGALAWERFATLLPDGTALEKLRALVRQYVGFEFAWDLRLILKRDDVPAWTLAGSRDRRVGRLGRTAWLSGSRNFRRTADAADLIMNVESIRLGPDRTAAVAA